jgi:REP element-mobilizing transposase RayT
MKRSKQISFEDPRLKKIQAFGGTLLKNKKNRHARPLCTKRSIHLILKSSQATGEKSFKHYKNSKRVQELCFKLARRYGIKIYEYGNAGNHIHLLIKLSNRFTYFAFIRNLTGTMVKKIMGSQKLTKKFWDYRPFSRVVEWSKAYRIAKDYVLLNQLEGLGIIPYQPNRLRQFGPGGLQAFRMT